MAVQNAENGVVWGSVLGALKVMGNATIRYSAYDFLFDFNRNYVSVFYRFRYRPTGIAGYLSKVDDFYPPHLHLAFWRPAGGDPGRISRRSLAPEN